MVCVSARKWHTRVGNGVRVEKGLVLRRRDAANRRRPREGCVLRGDHGVVLWLRPLAAPAGQLHVHHVARPAGRRYVDAVRRRLSRV